MNKQLKYGFRILFTLLPVLIYWVLNRVNIPIHFSLILGLIALPYVLQNGKQAGGFRYAVIALFLCISLLLIRSNSLFYFAALFIALFVLDNWWGHINALPLLLVMVVSPIISNVVYLWSFPIRLQLSKLAATTLQRVDFDIIANGNVMVMNGHSFAVDPACIGLNLVITAMVISITILAYFEKKHQKRLALWQASAMLCLILIGALVSNFIRLITLVVFHILPQNPLHDLVGLLSLGVYAVLPFYLFVGFIFKRYNFTNSKSLSSVQNLIDVSIPKKIVLVILFPLLMASGWQFISEPIESMDQLDKVNINGFGKAITENGILKLQNKEALIYVKAPVRSFQGSHDPRFCWQGGGYSFTSVQIEKLGARQCYTAILKKGNDTLFTAWWYQSKTSSTIEDWNWRWKTFRQGQNFYLVNVSCSSREELEHWVKTPIHF